MKKNKVIRTLAGYNKGIFKALNQAYGFNFEKPFEAVEIKTPFTIKKAVDALSKKDYLSAGGRVVILFHYPNDFYGWRKDKNIVVDVIGTGASDFNIEFDGSTEYPYSRAIGKFYAKYDFNDTRKDSEVKAYIIAQTAENRGKYRVYRSRNDYKDNYSERDAKHAGDTYTEGRYINGERVYEKVLRVDKSGYRVELKRQELKNRARALKEEREKSAFLATDNSERIKEVEETVNIAKKIIVERLNMADCEEDIYTIRNNGMYELIDAFRYLERIKKGEREKSFGSIETFNNYAKDAERAAKKIIAWNF